MALWAHLLLIPALFDLAVLVWLESHLMRAVQLILERQTEEYVWDLPVGKKTQSDVAHQTRCKIYTGHLKYTLGFGHLVTAFRLFLEGENEFVLKSFLVKTHHR